MANLAETSSFDGIPQLERTDIIDAGENGNGKANAQARALGNRTRYLKDGQDAQQQVLDGLGSAAQADVEDFIAAADKGADDGVCELVGGLVPSNRLPPIAINEVFTVESESEQLALVVESGDMAVRTDQAGQMYVRNNGAAGDMTDWTPVGIKLPITTDAPTDGKQYARKDGGWVEVVTSNPAVIDIYEIETTDHTLTIDDPGKMLMFDSATAVGITLTSSAGESDFPVKGQVTVANLDAGDITVTAGSGVTVKGPTTLSADAMHTIYRASADVYFIAGKEV